MKKKMYRPIASRNQAGFLLIQLTIALVVMMGIATIKLWVDTRALSEERAVTAADELKLLNDAVGNYQTQFFDKLTSGQPVAGFASPLQPSVAELISGGFVTNFSGISAYGGGYTIRVQTVPIPGPPAGTDLKALTCLASPITNPSNGRIDGPLLGTAVSRAGGNAGFSKPPTAATIYGADGAWNEPNPISASGTPVAGILCMRSGYGASGLLQLTRRDGTLQPTGNWNMGNFDVTAIKALGSTTLDNSGTANIGGQATTKGIGNTGAITNSGTLTNFGATQLNSTLSVAGQTNTSGIVNAGALTNAGATTLNSTLNVAGQTVTNGLTNYGNVTVTGDTSTNRLTLQAIVSNGGICTGLDGYQARTAAGSIISCINGVWQTPAANIPPPSPCNATSVTFGAGCTGNLPYTNSGGTSGVSMTSGSGWANYSCNNGSWGFVSGSCTPPPANCGGTSVSWSATASCSGSTGFLSSGSGQWVSATNGPSGSVFATCNNGSISLSSPTCEPTYYYYNNPTTREGYRTAHSPTNLTIFCGAQGRNLAPLTMQSGNNYYGLNVEVCTNFDGSLTCSQHSSCSDPAYAGPGCYVTTQAVCM